MNLHEQTLSSETVYSGSFLKLYRDTVSLPNGKLATREFIDHSGAAAILLLSDAQELLLVRQFRYAPKSVFLEIPAGKIDAGESVLETAQRELREETGYRAQTWHYLGAAAACIGYSNEHIHYFVAQTICAGEQALGEGEWLEPIWLPLSEVKAKSLRGEITDSKTLVGLYWLDAFLRGELDERR